MAWTANDPVSTPGKGTVYVAAFFLAVAAIAGVGLGFRASMRDTARGGAQGSVDDNLDVDQAQPARPMVEEFPNQVAPPPETNAAVNALAAATNTVVKKPDEADATNDIAVRTAAVQAAQSNPPVAGRHRFAADLAIRAPTGPGQALHRRPAPSGRD